MKKSEKNQSLENILLADWNNHTSHRIDWGFSPFDSNNTTNFDFRILFFKKLT